MKTDIKELIGKTITDVKEARENGDTTEVIFSCSDGTRFRMVHYEDCSEWVYLQDRCGEWEEIIGSPVLMAEAPSNIPEPEGHQYYGDSHTWTYYRITTQRGQVVLRWLGESNGYYAEGVDFERMPDCEQPVNNS